MANNCPCHAINAECDPDLCKSCFNTKDRIKKGHCQNQMIYFSKKKVDFKH